MSDLAAAGLSPTLANAIQSARAVTACTPDQARRAIGCLDLTSLNDDDDDTAIAALCDRATTAAGSVAAVCVYPAFVVAARRYLGDRPVKVATVVNFPGGQDPLDTVVAMTVRAVGDGADEIDVVLPYESLIRGRDDDVSAVVAAVRGAAGPTRTVKTILETSQLPDLAMVARASALAIDAGATFLKTSTGKKGHGATLEGAAIMLDAIARSGKPELGLKPSGGIRTAVSAAQFLTLSDLIMGRGWATADHFRIGASGVIDDLVATALGSHNAASPGGPTPASGEGY